MSKRKLSRIVKWWLTPKFPENHINKVLLYKPEGINNLIKDRLRIFIIHPIKRRMAKYYLAFLQKFFGLEVIAVTGSVGKTTAKEMLASVLSKKGKTVASYANIDPIYNIPTTILKCRPQTKFLVLEMGVEYPGEMDFYLWLAKPKTGVVTAIYWTHTEFLKDLRNVIKEKGKLIQDLPKNGLAVLNIDERSAIELSKKTDAEVIWIGLSEKSDVKSSNISFTKDFKTKFELITKTGRIDIRLNLLGQQFVPLALATVAVGLKYGIDLKEIKIGLEELKPLDHRMITHILKNRSTIIDDTYNANPLAAKEAIRLLADIANGKRKILVLGDMKELGAYEKKGHEEVGCFAVKCGIDKILTLGESTKYTISEALRLGLGKDNVFNFDNKKTLIKKLKATVKPRDVILIKGSRSMALEEVVESLRKPM